MLNQSEDKTPGWDAKAIARISKEKYGSMEAMFKHHGWPQRGTKMMPSVQRNVAEAYGSIESFVKHHEVP